MKCPHCLIEFHDNTRVTPLESDVEGGWEIEYYICPGCKKSILYLINFQGYKRLERGKPSSGAGLSGHGEVQPIVNKRQLVRPKNSSRPPVPKEVPKELAEDYTEACLVLSDSPKASAALSRRSLQHLLRHAAGIKEGNLANEIQQVLDGNQLPSYLSENIDAVRNIGNFAAHSSKSTSTGEIVNVEPGEAEWNLEVLEMLFDFYYVQPEKSKQRKAALNSKLRDAGKREMK